MNKRWLNGNLVPYIARDDFDIIATEFLTKYFSKALCTPMAVPIEAIAKKCLGLNVIYQHLSEDLSILGCTLFTEGCIEVYLKDNDEFVLKKYPQGTIIIDEDVLTLRNLGSLHYTLAHECVHWYKHRRYHILNDMVKEGQAIAHRFSGNYYKERSEADWMEWQAECIAARILMPHDMFIRAISMIKSGMKTEVSNQTINEYLVEQLSQLFQVSKQAVRYRLADMQEI